MKQTCFAACVFLSFACASAFADTGTARPDSHAPITVMGDHYHKRGEWMFSYRFMHMSMRDNRDGTTDLAPDGIVTGYANRFFGNPMQPPTLRVVPTEMSMDMHMLGAMYAPSDAVTLMFMTNLIRKEMDHITYMGGMGTQQLGRFTTETQGLGDSSISALVRLSEQGHHRWHLTVGMSAPTGATDETGQILTPMGMTPSPRLPYPMQLGSGTWDVLLGLTYAGHTSPTGRTDGNLGWGLQTRSVIRTGSNDEGYTLGDEHTLSGWMSWRLSGAVSTSARLQAYRRGNIDGIDPRIMAPVQTADPDNQGQTRLDLAVGVNMIMPDQRHRLALEWIKPLRQDLDGPQMKTDWQLTAGWQFSL